MKKSPKLKRRNIVLVGAGKMGSMLIHGFLKNLTSASQVSIVDPHLSSAQIENFEKLEIAVNRPIATAPDLLLLAIKPQSLGAASESTNSLIDRNTLVLSIMAGKTINVLQQNLPAAKTIIRAMPNSPALVGQAISGVFAPPGTSLQFCEWTQELLESVGGVVWLESEDQLDSVTALSGSGPAYVFYFVECLAKAGQTLGLSPQQAMILARTTLEGAGALLAHFHTRSPSSLREDVTSQGGTTAAGLAELMENDSLAILVEKTLTAARNRAIVLSE